MAHGLSCSVACGILLVQIKDWISVPYIGRWILLHCTTREVLALYFHLSFLPWVKVLHSTYYTFLLMVTPRNRDSRGNEGKRIKPPFCWAGSLTRPLPTHSSLSQSNPSPKGCPGVTGVGTSEQERKPRMYTGGILASFLCGEMKPGQHVHEAISASKHVYYLEWNRSPAQARCVRQVLGPGTLGRPKGIGWSGRWKGGSGWGIHVNPWLIHVNVWQKPLQLKKKWT